jgi:hypothetical protein
MTPTQKATALLHRLSTKSRNAIGARFVMTLTLTLVLVTLSSMNDMSTLAMSLAVAWCLLEAVDCGLFITRLYRLRAFVRRNLIKPDEVKSLGFVGNIQRWLLSPR